MFVKKFSQQKVQNEQKKYSSIEFLFILCFLLVLKITLSLFPPKLPSPPYPSSTLSVSR